MGNRRSGEGTAPKSKKHPTHGYDGVHYGVLKGRATKGRREHGGKSRHYRLDVKGERDGRASASWHVAIDVRSTEDSQLLFFVDGDVTAQAPDRAALGTTWTRKLEALAALPSGWTALEDHAAGVGLDYVRERHVDPSEMTRLPVQGAGANHDVRDEVDFWIARAIAQKAEVYVFGSRFDDGKHHGVHDVHLNQGNAGSWKRDDGIYQDGGIVLRFPSGRVAALYFAFASQSWTTDDRGDPR